MRESIVSCGSLAVFIFLSTLAFAQNNIVSGSIRNAKTKELLPAVSVEIRGTNVGTFSDDRGNFRLTTSRPFPLTLVFSSIGYELTEVTVSSSSSRMCR
jgi:hypothetical protein